MFYLEKTVFLRTLRTLSSAWLTSLKTTWGSQTTQATAGALKCQVEDLGRSFGQLKKIWRGVNYSKDLESLPMPNLKSSQNPNEISNFCFPFPLICPPYLYFSSLSSFLSFFLPFLFFSFPSSLPPFLFFLFPFPSYSSLLSFPLEKRSKWT